MRRSDDLVFQALADETRRRALGVLRRQELSVSELVETLQQPQSTVSRHLKVLREAGLIRDRRDRNTVMYSLATSPAEANGSDLGGRLSQWISEQPIPASLERRMHAVIGRRGDGNRRFFSRMARHWDGLREKSFGTSFHLEALVGLLPSEWTVVDIGTGTGYLLPVLSRCFGRVIGIDPVPEMLNVARGRVTREGLQNVELHRGEIERLPLPTASVDLAVAVLVLHHVAAPRGALGELARVLRGGGCTLIVEQGPHQDHDFRERMQDRWWGFERAEMCDWMAQAGFVNIRSRDLSTSRTTEGGPELFTVTGEKAS